MNTPIKNRYDFIGILDVENGNPNGDPDNGNMPRQDHQTGIGKISDVCLKRKIRNYIELVKEDDAGFRIFVKEGVPLNQNNAEAYIAVGLTPGEKKQKAEDVARAREWLCKNFYDVRTFGAVLSTGDNCGQVTGPVQIEFAKSVDPITPEQVGITRVTVTKIEDAEKERAMGNKWIVPYGLYVFEGHVSPKLANHPAKGTGFSEEDLELLWDAIVNMFEHDHSAARGKMVLRKLIIFKHDSELGNAPSHKLFERVRVARKSGANPPRAFSDYEVTIDAADLPDGVTIIEK